MEFERVATKPGLYPTLFFRPWHSSKLKDWVCVTKLLWLQPVHQSYMCGAHLGNDRQKGLLYLGYEVRCSNTHTYISQENFCRNCKNTQCVFRFCHIKHKPQAINRKENTSVFIFTIPSKPKHNFKIFVQASSGLWGTEGYCRVWVEYPASSQDGHISEVCMRVSCHWLSLKSGS